MTSLMEMEQQRGLKFNFRGLNIVLWVEHTESNYGFDKCRIGCSDRFVLSRLHPSIDPCICGEHPGCLLEHSRGGFKERHVERFLTSLTTRPLFVSSFINPEHEMCNCSPSHIQPIALYQFFIQVVKRAPHFQLEHLQNFPPLEAHFEQVTCLERQYF